MQAAMQKTGLDIATIFNVCFSVIEGRKNPDVIDYLKSREQKITRDVFFGQ